MLASENNYSQFFDAMSSVPVLTDDNWGIWYERMEAYCLMKDLDDIINGTETAPIDPTALATFRKREKHIIGVILMKLSSHLRDLIVNDENKSNAHLLWNDIKSHFMSTRNQHRLFSKLFSLKCDDNDVATFMKTAKATLNELELIGVKIDQEMIAYYLLHRMPPTYAHLKSSIIHRAETTDTSLSANYVINLLQ